MNDTFALDKKLVHDLKLAEDMLSGETLRYVEKGEVETGRLKDAKKRISQAIERAENDEQS